MNFTDMAREALATATVTPLGGSAAGHAKAVEAMLRLYARRPEIVSVLALELERTWDQFLHNEIGLIHVEANSDDAP
jgi:hypothetical protein